MGEEHEKLNEETREPVDEQAETNPQAVQAEAQPEPAPEPTPELRAVNHIAEKRGRMVAAGLIATVILSVIALGVSALFQLSSRWGAACPSDLPVNDPAPLLWKDLATGPDKSAPLGVSKNLMKEASWKAPETSK
jgi:hypothetical protein